MKISKPKISKKKIAIFSVFVFIATIFWFLNALSNDYTTKLDYPVNYFNYPNNLLPQSELPENISVTVNAYGFDILWKLTVSKPLEIDIQKHAVKDKTDQKKFIINTNVFTDELFPNIANIKVLSINPEVIVFETRKIESKKVPVKTDISYSFKELYMQSGPMYIKPDSIFLFAGKNDLKKVKYVETGKKEFKELDDTLFTKLKIKPIQNINFSVGLITLIVPVEKFTEKSIPVPVIVKNCPDSLRLITFPKESKMTFKITLSHYDSISYNDFELFVDYNDISKNKSEKLQIYIKGYPKSVKDIKLSPDYLEFVIEKQERIPNE